MDEAFGMDAIGGIENGLALFENERGLVVVDHGRRHQTESGMAVFVVVPGEEALAEGLRAILDRAKAIRKLRPVLQGAEVAFRIRVVVGDVGATVRLGDAEIGQEKGDGLGGHRGAAIGVDGQLTGLDVLLRAGVLDESSGELRALARRHHPAGDIAAEDIQDDVEVKVGPLGRTEQFGYNPQLQS